MIYFVSNYELISFPLSRFATGTQITSGTRIIVAFHRLPAAVVHRHPVRRRPGIIIGRGGIVIGIETGTGIEIGEETGKGIGRVVDTGQRLPVEEDITDQRLRRMGRIIEGIQ